MPSEIRRSIRLQLPATFGFLKISGGLSVMLKPVQLCIYVPSTEGSPRTCVISGKCVQVNNVSQRSLVIQGEESI